MTVTKLFIARHGETEFNRTRRMQGRGIDEPLNERGRFQADALGRFLKSRDIHHVASSSLRRSIETAEIAGGHLGLNVESHPELDEIDFGELEGHEFEEIKDALIHLHETWKSGDVSFAPAGGESPEMVFNRAQRKIKLILDRQKGSNILLVLHGRLIRIILSKWLGYGLHNMHRIEHSNGSLNLILWDEQEFRPDFLHKTDHIEEFFDAAED